MSKAQLVITTVVLEAFATGDDDLLGHVGSGHETKGPSALPRREFSLPPVIFAIITGRPASRR